MIGKRVRITNHAEKQFIKRFYCVASKFPSAKATLVNLVKCGELKRMTLIKSKGVRNYVVNGNLIAAVKFNGDKMVVITVIRGRDE